MANCIDTRYLLSGWIYQSSSPYIGIVAILKNVAIATAIEKVFLSARSLQIMTKI